MKSGSGGRLPARHEHLDPIPEPRDPLSPVAQEAVRRLTQRGDRPLVATQNLVESWVVAMRPLSANGASA